MEIKPSQIVITAPIAGYVEKWLRFSDNRRSFAKRGDKVAALRTSEGQSVDVVAPSSGNISSILVDIGAYVKTDQVIAYMKLCEHPALFNSMCVSCGDIIAIDEQTSTQSVEKSPRDNRSGQLSSSSHESSANRVTVLSSGRQLQLTKTEAEYFQTAKQSGLRSARKLALVLDLDHTLIHACERSFPATPEENANGISTISLEEVPFSGLRHYLVKLRPHLFEFLEEAAKLCQLSIYTAGTRKYAEGISQVIDPERKYFLGRIVSRSDNFVSNIGTADDRYASGIEKSLSRLFLSDASLAVIIDDREDVWRGSQSEQLLLVRPYKYFLDVPEVNNASGMSSVIPNPSQQHPAILLSSNPPGVAAASQSIATTDDQLVRSLGIIKEIHHAIYNSLDSSLSSERNVSAVLNKMKSEILRGCSLCFSGVIPVNMSYPQSHFLWQLALSLGATVSNDVSPTTTHLICTNVTSAKVSQLRKRKNVWILHPDWLFYCRWAMARALETTFSLVPLDISNIPSNQADYGLIPHEGATNDNINEDDSSRKINDSNSSYSTVTENNDQNSQVFKRARTEYDDTDEKSWKVVFQEQSNSLSTGNSDPSEVAMTANEISISNDDDDDDDDDWDFDEAIKDKANHKLDGS